MWDADRIYGCKCDPGYHGSACEDRNCPVGVDPLYTDSGDVSVHVTTVTFAIFDAWCQEHLEIEPYYLRRQLLSKDQDFIEETASDEAAFAAEQRRRLLAAPTAVPIPAPTKVPIPAPTQVPIPAPTQVPIPAPTTVSLKLTIISTVQ